jgi:hypothetical protein
MLEIGTSGLMSGEEKRVFIRLTSAADTALLLDSTQFWSSIYGGSVVKDLWLPARRSQRAAGFTSVDQWGLFSWRAHVLASAIADW